MVRSGNDSSGRNDKVDVSNVDRAVSVVVTLWYCDFYRSCRQPFVVIFFGGPPLSVLWCGFPLFMGPVSTRHERFLAFAFPIVFGNVGYYIFSAWGMFSFFYGGDQRQPLCLGRIVSSGRCFSRGGNNGRGREGHGRSDISTCPV